MRCSPAWCNHKASWNCYYADGIGAISGLYSFQSLPISEGYTCGTAQRHQSPMHTMFGLVDNCFFVNNRQRETTVDSYIMIKNNMESPGMVGKVKIHVAVHMTINLNDLRV